LKNKLDSLFFNRQFESEQFTAMTWRITAMIKKLRIKFVLINMTIIMVMLCIIFGFIYHFTRIKLESDSINMMRNIASHPFRLRMPNERPEDVRLPYFTLQIGSDGELIATGGGDFDLSDEEFLRDLFFAASTSPEHIGIVEDYNLRYCRVTTPVDQFIVFADISSELKTLHNLLGTCFAIGLSSFLVFLGISLLLARWAVKPVEQAWLQQRQFIADASHELKTPLTVIMTNAELMQNPDFDEESHAKFSSSILAMSHQMKGLVEQMLELARSDNATDKIMFSQVDFSKLVSDALLPFEPVFFEKGLRLTSQICEGIQVNGDAAKLHQVLDILLDNAQKYSHESGNTNVILKKHGKGHCVLTVSNEGDAISQEDLKNLFKRFYRADEARSQTGSFGLGLSIAESIIRQHKGKIWAESRNGINSFQVWIACL